MQIANFLVEDRIWVLRMRKFVKNQKIDSVSKFFSARSTRAHVSNLNSSCIEHCIVKSVCEKPAERLQLCAAYCLQQTNIEFIRCAFVFCLKTFCLFCGSWDAATAAADERARCCVLLIIIGIGIELRRVLLLIIIVIISTTYEIYRSNAISSYGRHIRNVSAENRTEKEIGIFTDLGYCIKTTWRSVSNHSSCVTRCMHMHVSLLLCFIILILILYSSFALRARRISSLLTGGQTEVWSERTKDRQIHYWSVRISSRVRGCQTATVL